MTTKELLETIIGQGLMLPENLEPALSVLENAFEVPRDAEFKRAVDEPSTA